MDYLPFQRIAKQADAYSAEWESLRELVEAVVNHRLNQAHAAADRLLSFDLPRRLAVMCDLSSENDCRARVEELFREAYQHAAMRRIVGDLLEAGSSSAPVPFPVPDGRPSRQVASAAHAVPSRRSFQEPGEAEIASMIDDMLSGQRP